MMTSSLSDVELHLVHQKSLEDAHDNQLTLCWLCPNDSKQCPLIQLQLVHNSHNSFPPPPWTELGTGTEHTRSISNKNVVVS